MKTILTRMFTVVVLMMLSMGAQADVKVLYGEKGTEKFEGKGGSIKIEQADSKVDKTKVTVYLTFISQSGYTFEEKTLEVYAVVSPDGASTRAPEILGDPLKLTEKKTDVPSAKRYSVDIDSNLGLWVKRAEFQLTGAKNRGGLPEITSDDDESGTIDDSEKKLYLIQTNGFQSFYIAPQADNTITTNNILGDYMLWYFLDAGVVNGTQYYYIVSNSVNKYICHGGGTANTDTSRGVTLVDKTSSNDERCKFYIEVDNSNGTTDFYNIDAKGKPTYFGLNKRNGSQSNIYPIRLTNSTYIHDFNSKWKFIRYDGTFTWPDPPFTPSDDSEKHYYEIQNYQKQTYYASTDATPNYVTFTNQDTDRRAWYFKEAPTDPSEHWFKYYYIINPATGGKYMYYNGTATNGNNQTDAVSVKTYDTNNEDRYQFVVVQAARGDFESNKDTRKTCYAIIPKLLVDKLWSSNSLGLAEGSISDDAKMGIISSRSATNSAQWDFNSIVFSTVCDDPVISFDRTTGKASITTTTSWPKIYYTTDGITTPSSTNGTLYEEPFSLTEETTIKAIVTKEGYTNSDVATKTIYKVATPTIQQETGTHNISITTTTTGATIYYTTDGTTIPTTSSTLYTGASEELGGKPIKAIAVKDGMINSDIGEGEIDIKCATPAISFNNATSEVSITCETEGSTIHYTTDGSTPTASSAEYETSFSVTSPTTVKAIATHATKDPSDMAELVISKVATPTIQDNGSNAISITTTTPDATIYYTIDDTDPTTSISRFEFSGPLTENVSNVYIRAIAVKENMITSEEGNGKVILQCATPVITRDGMTFSISCSMPTDATLYYTLGSGSEVEYTGTPVPFPSDDLPMTVTAVARHSDYTDSETASMTLLNGTGTPEDPYLIYGTTDLANFVTNVNNGTTSSACYKLEVDVSGSGVDPITNAFSGTFDGGLHIISNLSHALFNTIDGGTVKNVILNNVSISDGTSVTVGGETKVATGAICNVAKGTTSRIYNCGVLSGAVSGSDIVGGLVGLIEESSSVRVVNCYNYANVSASGTDSYAAGIVGRNAGTVGDVRIALCMMYGTVSGATNISPVYAGNHTPNAQNFNEYNYYLYSIEKDDAGQRIIRIPYTAYNDQLAIDKEEYLTRFPFYRHILNTHRELASYFLFGDYAENHVNEIGHWVLNKEMANYPIVEEWKTNTSKVLDAPSGATVSVRKGEGTPITSLNVTVKIGNNTYNNVSLPITGMDEANYDYIWGKVVLPFANEFEVNTDYTQICTGWKITNVIDGSTGTFENYNFADRDCTAKDIYDEDSNPFIYAQGGYYIVPYDVTAIEITANFAKAHYLSDATYEIGYKSDYTGRTGLGGNVPTFHDQTVHTSLTNAVNALTITTTNPHKQAIVLVGNYHYDLANTALATTKGFTLMSIDADNNQEPDYGFYSIASDRPRTPALRFDFVPIISLGMAAKVNGSNYYPGVPIWKSRGWYEQTETTISIMNQFELDSGNFTLDETDAANLGKGKNPCIINGGYFVQMIRSNNASCSKVSYFKIGGNAYIKEFYPGSHSNKTFATTIVPVNVTGGQVDECFMTGYKSGATAIGSDIRFWCSGGKIGKFLGAYMDKPKQTSSSDGNVNMTAYVDHALIGRFFGGGTSQSAAITGDITVTINNSKVDFYCGGPEFGNMNPGKVVNTTANNTRFGEYYGAGFGGTSITYSPKDGTPNIGPNVTFSGYTYNTNRLTRNASLGFVTCYKFEFLMHSANKNQLVARFITGYANFNLATTGNVTNNLKGCIIEKDFYGAGCQGKVDGIVNSTLTNCTLMGSAFGGGFKAKSNEVMVYPADAPRLSVYNGETGIFSEFGTTEPATFTWVQGTTAKQNTYDDCDSNGEGGKLYTSKDINMSDLGNVTGAISITIDGGTVAHDVFGGGNESKSLDKTSVTIQNGASISGDVFGAGKGKADDETVAYVTLGTTVTMSGGSVGKSVYGGGQLAQVGGDTEIEVTGGTIGVSGSGGATYGNVYGGGKGSVEHVEAGLIKGNTKISISQADSETPTIIYHNIYGGGAYGSVGTYTYDSSGKITVYTSGGTANVTIKGGTIGTDGDENGMVFGSSRGDVDEPGSIQDRLAWVHDTHVIIGISATGTEGEEGYVAESGPDIKGSVYGSGENGHTYQNTIVDVHGGTIGITSGEKVTDDAGIEYEGAAYPYRGNVYGGGCGTDKYASVANGPKDTFNPLAGIVQGNATVNIDGGQVVRNVYGAGAMGSVGKVVSTTTNNVTTTTTTGGLTTINISGGTIGVSGLVGDGNVFGAARGDKDAVGNEVANHAILRLANVRETRVTISNGSIIKGNVYGGGEVGSVGTYSVSNEGDDYMKIYTFENNTGACNVTINGGTIGTNVESVNGIFANGNVYGAGKGLANTFWCEKGMVYSTNVAINAGTVYGTVYGGGEVGRVENNATVTIGVLNPEGTTPAPSITGNVFGAGAGIETHGYSALLRGDTKVTVQGNAHVGLSVYGGGEKASVGRFVVDKGVPKEPANDGSGDCTVKVQGNAVIAGSVYGTGQGVTPHYYTNTDTYATTAEMPRRMMAITMGKFDSSNQDYWQYVSDDDHNNVWEYLNTKQKYLDFLPTLALASHPEVTIGGSAAVSGSVYGGGQRGITLGTVVVNMTGGTVTGDVYGGGALADTNKGNWDASTGTWAEGKSSAFFTTTVNLTGGKLRNAYGGGLGQIEREAGQGVTALESIAALVYGNVLVELNNNNNGETADKEKIGCIVERVFGCNNQNGTPMGHVKVHVYATQNADTENCPHIENKKALHTTVAGNLPETGSTSTYDVLAVYGGGNLSPYEPAGGKNTPENTEVIIDGCNLTSIRQVYGGGNAAPAPATYVRVNGTWEIEEVFGGGNGKDDYDLYGKTYLNPGANVGYYNYTHAVWNDTKNKYETIDYTADDGDGLDASTKPKRQANWGYGTGVARTEIAGGKIHYVYGASNERGNIREVAISKYEELDDGCPMVLDQTYGGGKNSIIDGRIDMGLGCVHEMKETFGGSSAADVNSDIVLNITNGTYERVFGGNNTSGNVNGSITVNIYEDGCSPVRIGELYLGGYLAGYSIYGYKEVNGQQVPRTKEDWTALSAAQKEAEGLTVPRKDPRINVISATRIDNIYGGGYEAVVVGNPHVNVNMERGRIKGEYNTTDNPITTGLHEYEGNSNYNYTVEAIDGTTKDATLSIGTIGNIYGGGNRADIVGNTYVEMGTGMWLNADDVWETKNAAGVNYTYDATDKVWKYLVTTGEGDQQTTETAPTPARYTAKVTGNVFGGGDNATVQGNTYVNVCAVNNDDPATTDVIELIGVTLPATVGSDVTIGGSVYGGGSKGAVGTYTTSTNASGGKEYNFSEDTGTCNVTIAGGTVGPETPTETSPGNVFGGGMGEALNSGTGAFMCEKAMVDHTNVVISNGTVNGTVYGGGEVGRVNHDTRVTIGMKRANTTDPAVSKPVVEGSVYGAGKGLSTHGYAALVRGNSYVTVQGDSKVKESVYGGGEIASVGKYTLDAAGMPQSLANQNSGYCTVIVQDNAEIGPDVAMKMITESGYPDDAGHVFGAGRGILPYEGYDLTDPDDIPWRVKGNDQQQWFGSGTVEINGAQVSVEYVPDDNQDDDYKKAYLRYIESQGLATQTYVTIAGNALVKGSVYGGSMNGHVQHNTQVTIAGGQIGCQKNTTGRLDPSVWGADYQVPDGTDLECASWDFTGDHLPYDIYDYQTGTTKPKPATDGHTFFGNVFGGGSGYYPYRQDPDYDTKDQVTGKSRKDLGYSDGLWHREAGSVGGSTVVNITGGHILTSVYGGNEQTDVGTYVKDSNYENTTTVVSGGKCTINMSGGTVGVPRTVAQMKAHPVTCYIFGAGKGDQRINFNKWTNVASTQVNISGEARIYGSTFGGGEDGHVVGNVETNIGGNVIIGTTGTSGVDGNIFGGGRGFSETALTAGVVGGDVAVNIHNGTILGTVFGGGRLASVGTHFADAESADYGTMQNTITPATYYTDAEIAAAVEGDDAYGKSTSDIKTPESKHGQITVTIDGGTIGATDSNGKLATSDFSIGDVFGGCKGSSNDVHFGMSKNTIVSISGAAKVNGNVYGGGEAGDVGTITRDLSSYNYTWTNSDGESNTPENNTAPNDNKNSGICKVTITGGTIGDGKTSNKGNVFGAGKGIANTFWCEKAIAYATNVSISGATTVNGNVYGGGEVGRVEDDTKVIIGTASGSDQPDIKGSVYGAGAGKETHGYSALVRGNSIVTIQGNTKVEGSVFGGGETASLGRFILDENKMPKEPDGGGSSTVTITDNAKIGLSGTDHDVYGAGQGVTPEWKYDVSDSYDDRMNNSKRMVTYTPYNSETGKGHQSDDEMKKWDYYPYPVNHPDYHKYVWEYYPDEVAYLEYLKTLAIASHPNVTIKKSATINGDVYGGGQRGVTLGDVEVNITGGTVAQDVYGGGALADTNKGNWDDSQYVAVTGLTSGKSSVKGLYTRTGSGTTEDPYKYAMTTDETAVENTQYYSKGTWATGKYNETTHATTYKTKVTLTGGTIQGNVYGGGLGQIGRAGSEAVGTEGQSDYVPAVTKLDEVKAKVYGDVLVSLNGTKTAVTTGTGDNTSTTYVYNDNCVVEGNIFGCNNQNGSPQSAVTVHVFKTEGWGGHMGTAAAKLDSETAADHSYHVKGVYGGGNLSAYYPDLAATRDTTQAYVIIDGCDLTSIQTVYGGGNAASSPATNVTINGTYEIEEVFGGGNGKENITINGVTVTNPGANVGYVAYPTDYDIPNSSKAIRTAEFGYGSGKASVNIFGGVIHRVFGGSNTKGNVRETAVTMLEETEGCHFQVDEAYGGGKSAPMDAEAKLLMACIPGLKSAFGGAQEADILGGVTMTITNGTFDRVFGGNNISGTIQGPIVVNIEEMGCRPIIIGELYGGGNLAGYSVFGYNADRTVKESGNKLYDDPVLNVKSFTSIGDIYGGGYGETATMVASPTVNINVAEGKYKDKVANSSDVDYGKEGYKYNENGYIGTIMQIDGHEVTVPPHKAGNIGVIQNVFGGGNAAKVIGNPNVNIGTRMGADEYMAVVEVPENVAGLYTRTGAGTTESPYVYNEVTGTSVTPSADTTYYKKYIIKGADIRGNVYGGGNNAKVTGDTNVTIGKKATP